MRLVVEPFVECDGIYSYARWRVRDADAATPQLQFFADFAIQLDALNYLNELQERQQIRERKRTKP